MFIWASARWHLKKFPTTVRNQSASCWNFMTNSPRQQFCTSSPPARLFSQSFCMYGFIFFGACVSFSMRVGVLCVLFLCPTFLSPIPPRVRAFQRTASPRPDPFLPDSDFGLFCFSTLPPLCGALFLLSSPHVPMSWCCFLPLPVPNQIK